MKSFPFLSIIFALLALFALSMKPAFAQNDVPPAPYADKQLEDPERERVARQLMESLRCIKCRSQSIADSNAPIAGDMRSIVREQIEQGRTPNEVRNWLIKRYGDWVSYDPNFNANTWPLFIVPFFIFLVVTVMGYQRYRRVKRG